LKEIPLVIKPMLAALVPEPFHKPGWVYEEKYDGDRILAYKEGDQVRLLSRKGIDRREGFPHVVTAIRSLRATTLLLDGEMVVFDRKSISRFQLLQQGKGDRSLGRLRPSGLLAQVLPLRPGGGATRCKALRVCAALPKGHHFSDKG